MRFCAAMAAAMAATAALDLLWLGVVAKDFYRRSLGHLMADAVNWPPAVLFYALYAAGVVHFAAGPALRAGSPRSALLNGAALGLLAYGTYDLTNMAVLRDWGWRIAAVDMAWGVLITAVSTGAAYAAGHALGWS